MEGARNSDGGGLADHRPADDGGYFVEPEMLTTPTRSSFTEAQSQTCSGSQLDLATHQCLITLECRELSHKVNTCNMFRMPTDIALKCKVLNALWHYLRAQLHAPLY